MEAEVYRRAREFREQLLGADEDARRLILQAYGQAWGGIGASLESLIRYLLESGDPITEGQLLRLERYQQLMDQIESQLTRFGGQVEIVVSLSQQQQITAAALQARELLATATGGPLGQVTNLLPTGALENLVGVLQDGAPVSRHIAATFPGVQERVKQLLLVGLAAGKGPREIARKISGALEPPTGKGQGKGPLAAALRTSRTEILRAHREATRANYQQHQDIVQGWIWLSARGTHVCAACLAMDGTTHSLAEPMGTHPNCFLPGTVTRAPGVIASTARRYEGEALDIRIEGGAILSVTPNHPILTLRGWVAAGMLREGDDVIECVNSKRMFAAINPDYDDTPSLIENVLKPGGRSSRVTATTVEVSPEDFHGDGANSQICVIRTNGLLRDRLNPFPAKPFFEQKLVGRSPKLFNFPSASALDQLSLRPLDSSNGVMRSDSISRSLLRCAGCGKDTIGFGAPPDRYFSINEALAYYTPGDSEVFGESLFPLASQVTSDNLFFRQFLESGVARARQVLSIAHRFYIGHVYNLQTATGWYIANNIVTHNCRCSMLPWLSGDPAPTNTGEAWLERQSHAVQAEVLGRSAPDPAAAKAFRAGRVRLADFVQERHSGVWGTTRTARALGEAIAANVG